jgi:hypothetical protein
MRLNTFVNYRLALVSYVVGALRLVDVRVLKTHVIPQTVDA